MENQQIVVIDLESSPIIDIPDRQNENENLDDVFHVESSPIIDIPDRQNENLDDVFHVESSPIVDIPDRQNENLDDVFDVESSPIIDIPDRQNELEYLDDVFDLAPPMVRSTATVDTSACIDTFKKFKLPRVWPRKDMSDEYARVRFMLQRNGFDAILLNGTYLENIDISVEIASESRVQKGSIVRKMTDFFKKFHQVEVKPYSVVYFSVYDVNKKYPAEFIKEFQPYHSNETRYK